MMTSQADHKKLQKFNYSEEKILVTSDPLFIYLCQTIVVVRNIGYKIFVCLCQFLTDR